MPTTSPTLLSFHILHLTPNAAALQRKNKKEKEKKKKRTFYNNKSNATAVTILQNFNKLFM